MDSPQHPVDRAPHRRRTRSRRGRLVAALACATFTAGLLTACGGGSGGPPTITFYNQPSSDAAQVAAIARCNSLAGGRYRIEFDRLPSGSDQQRQQLVRRLAAKDSSVDLLGLDVTWPTEFWNAGWLLEWTGTNKAAVTEDALPGPLATATVDTHIVSAPFTSNTQLLWYRKDLVATPPTTWTQMISMAQKLAAQRKPAYIEEQGAQYEGLTVWFNSLVASAGGSILNADDTKASLGQPAVRAAQIMKQVASTPGISDPSLSVNMEDQARLALEAGSAAFEINYPFVWPSMQANNPKTRTYNGRSLKQNFAWAPFPSVAAGRAGKSSIGGIDIGVSRYTTHRDLAFAAARCLVDAGSQQILAIQGGLPPVSRSLYAHPTKAFVTAYPFYKLIEQQLADAAVRPRTAAYQSVSIAVSSTLSPPGSISPQSDVDSLKGQISDALQSKGLIP